MPIKKDVQAIREARAKGIDCKDLVLGEPGGSGSRGGKGQKFHVEIVAYMHRCFHLRVVLLLLLNLC